MESKISVINELSNTPSYAVGSAWSVRYLSNKRTGVNEQFIRRFVNVCAPRCVGAACGERRCDLFKAKKIVSELSSTATTPATSEMTSSWAMEPHITDHNATLLLIPRIKNSRGWTNTSVRRGWITNNESEFETAKWRERAMKISEIITNKHRKLRAPKVMHSS